MDEKFDLGIQFVANKPENPKVGTFWFSKEQDKVFLFTDSGWLEMCKYTNEMKEEINRPEKERKEHKELISKLFGRELDI